MLSKIKHTLLMAGLSTLPGLAIAHPGHDHAHWSGPLVHAMLFVSIVAVVAMGGLLLRRRFQRIKLEKEN